MRNYRARGITPDGKPIFAEVHEHITVAHWLAVHGVLFIHVPNEGRRAWQTGKTLKLMGMRAGVSDFIIFDTPPKYPSSRGTVLELKALDGNVPTDNQNEFLADMRLLGWLSSWQRGADAAIRWLESLGYSKR